nr:transcription repressor OFP7-like isoform X2 [Ipomoea batatas]
MVRSRSADDGEQEATPVVMRTRITQQLNNSTKFITAVDFPVTNTHRSSSALRRHVSSALISVGCSLTSRNSGDDNDEEVDDGDDFGEANVREGGSGTAVAVLSVFEFEAVPWDYRGGSSEI